MSRTFLLLREPAANRVYSRGADRLAAAELALLCPEARDVQAHTRAGVEYVCFTADAPPAAVGHHSSLLALYAVHDSEEGDLLRPVEVARPEVFENDLVTIPRYAGKTNEQFTRLMVNLTLAAVRRPPGPDGARRVLDPLCGRGTTLTTALRLGHDSVGVDRDAAALDATAAFLRSYLRRSRLKHTAAVTPVRREGRRVGRRLDVEVRPPAGGPRRSLSVLEGDARRSDEVCGKRGFDAVVLDAPYGVVHGSHGAEPGAGRDRSPADLLAEAVPVWARQLYGGGALGIAWNTLGLGRDDLVAVVRDAGLTPLDDGPWRELAHRVDSSIHRDLLVAVRET